MRTTLNIATLLGCFLKEPDSWLWRAQLERVGGVARGSLFEALDNLAAGGYLATQLEGNPARRGSRRRFYRITPAGKAYAREIAAQLREIASALEHDPGTPGVYASSHASKPVRSGDPGQLP